MPCFEQMAGRGFGPCPGGRMESGMGLGFGRRGFGHRGFACGPGRGHMRSSAWGAAVGAKEEVPLLKHQAAMLKERLDWVNERLKGLADERNGANEERK